MKATMEEKFLLVLLLLLLPLFYPINVKMGSKIYVPVQV